MKRDMGQTFKKRKLTHGGIQLTAPRTQQVRLTKQSKGKKVPNLTACQAAFLASELTASLYCYSTTVSVLFDVRNKRTP